jgi:PD-(D/E)XK nuclease superfamily
VRELKSFATKEYPLHASAINVLLSCPWRMASVHLNDDQGEGGVAGDTGSAMHAAASAFHTGKGEAESLESMGERIKEYPQADLQDAARLFLTYAADTRNRNVEFLLVERAVEFTIAPDPQDHTGALIQIVGRCDQVRLHEDGKAKVWDIKTSKRDPNDVLIDATFQIAAYCIGASVLLNRTIEPGGVIMPRQYKANISTSPVFRHCAWKFSDIEQILSPVRRIVAAIRAGILYHRPNPDCKWCEYKSPDLCLPKLKEICSLSKSI